MKKNKGITLIALIITIIVMLTLVSVSVSIFVDSDLIGTTEKTADKWNEAISKEEDAINEALGILTEIKQQNCNHEWGEWTVVKEPTYQEAGERYKTCTKCKLKQTEYPSMLACEEHTYSESDWVVDTEATCQTKGAKHIICTTCGTRIEAEIAIDTENGHNYENGTCTICGKTSLPVITAGERATKNSTYSDGTDTAMIPAKFTVSGAPTENTISGGLVIYLIDDKTDEEIAAIDWEEDLATLKTTYDQFVWIPIKNETDANVQDINDMYMCQNKGTGSYGTTACVITVPEATGVATCSTHGNCTAMAGRLYASSKGENFEKGYTEVYTAGTGLREPDTVSDFDGNSTYLGYLNTILGTSYSTEANLKTALQDEYNNIVKSVYLNQGFYVGRYETSGMAQDETSYDVAVIAGTLPSVETDWYHMYAQQRKYASSNSLEVGSTMIQGAAYDQVMKFVDTDDYDVTTAGEVGHSFSSRYETGSQSGDESKNIFDLEGNVLAWTTEARYASVRVSRGR